jgi:hypothetical protein
MKAPAALTLVENGDYPSKIDTWVKARRKGPVLVPPATPEPQPEPFKLQAVGDPSACGVRNRADALCNVDRKADANYSAYAPDVPGCVATGDTVAAVEREKNWLDC